jgi:hypothetical protein
LRKSSVARLADDLPRYQLTMSNKIKSVRGATATSGTLERAADVLEDLGKELNKPRDPASARRGLVAIHSGISAKPTRLSRLAPLIAFCVDARGPRATSGQDRAYSAARDDIPDRTALSANNWRARRTISEPRRRNLTLHLKTVGPSKYSYALMAPIASVVRSLRGDAQVSQLRRTHESAVVRASSPTPERLPLLMVSMRPNPSSISRLDEPA